MTNKQYKSFQSLVKRIASQQHFKNNQIFDLSELESAGWEGVVEGLQKYNSGKSNMSERSVVAYYVRFAILSYINKGAQLIPSSQHVYKKNGPIYKVNIEDVIYKDLDEDNYRDSEIEEEDGEYEEMNYDKEISLIFQDLPQVEVEFIRDEFGIGTKKISRKEMCEKYQVTSGYISIRLKKAFTRIRSNTKLMNILKMSL